MIKNKRERGIEGERERDTKKEMRKSCRKQLGQHAPQFEPVR